MRYAKKGMSNHSWTDATGEGKMCLPKVHTFLTAYKWMLLNVKCKHWLKRQKAKDNVVWSVRLFTPFNEVGNLQFESLISVKVIIAITLRSAKCNRLGLHCESVLQRYSRSVIQNLVGNLLLMKDFPHCQLHYDEYYESFLSYYILTQSNHTSINL